MLRIFPAGSRARVLVDIRRDGLQHALLCADDGGDREPRYGARGREPRACAGRRRLPEGAAGRGQRRPERAPAWRSGPCRSRRVRAHRRRRVRRPNTARPRMAEVAQLFRPALRASRTNSSLPSLIASSLLPSSTTTTTTTTTAPQPPCPTRCAVIGGVPSTWSVGIGRVCRLAACVRLGMAGDVWTNRAGCVRSGCITWRWRIGCSFCARSRGMRGAMSCSVQYNLAHPLNEPARA
mmetsp:Transcript_13333/g.35851  ORF Transcript_13333/g.35851 Transcript_13333/m.35851 type:complete len:237 (-) Transcript_13333:34-744(-)